MKRFKQEVELARIAAIGETRIEPREIKIAKRIQAMVDGHRNHSVRGEMPAIVQRIHDASARVGSAVDVDHDRQIRAAPGLRRPDVEEQAILALRFVLVVFLWRRRTEVQRIDDLREWLRRHRSSKPLPRPVANAAKNLQAAFD